MLVPRLLGAGCWVLGGGSGLTRGSSGQPPGWGANARTDIPARGSRPPLKKPDHTGLQGPTCEWQRAVQAEGRAGQWWVEDGGTDRCTHSAQSHQFSRRMLPTPSGTLIYFFFGPRPLSPVVNHSSHSSGHVLGSEHSHPPGGCAKSHLFQTQLNGNPLQVGPCLGGFQMCFWRAKAQRGLTQCLACGTAAQRGQPCGTGNSSAAWLGCLPPPCSEGSLLAISSPKDEQRGPYFSGVGQVIQILAPE